MADQTHAGRGPAGTGPGTRAGPGAIGDPAEPYVGSRIERRLAEDPRTSELGIQVRLSGERIFLKGEVASADRRARVLEVVRELVPDLDIVDDLTVTEAAIPDHGPGEPEVLR